MLGRCPQCNARFAEEELAKLKKGMDTYKDQSQYANCKQCGRYFVPNIIYATLFLITLVSFGILSCIFAFIIDAAPQGMCFGAVGFLLYIFREQVQQYLPVVDVSDTDL